MQPTRILLGLAAMAAVYPLLPDSGAGPPTAEPRIQTHAAQPHPQATSLLHRIPSPFVPNLGQWDHGARYVARLGPVTAFVEEGGWTLALLERAKAQPRTRGPDLRTRDARSAHRGAAVRMGFVDAAKPKLAAGERLPGVHNYFLGNDPAKWRSDVPLHASVRMAGVYPGVDVRLREEDGHMEYDVLLEPGADLAQVEIRVEGTEGLRLDADGSLCIDTALGPIRQPRPETWEVDAEGEKHSITCDFVLLGEDRFGFAAPGRQPDWALVVDPGLIYSTFLGGSDDDRAEAVALDPSGAVIVAGSTDSPDFPVTPGVFAPTWAGSGWEDAFVTRLSASGSSLVYSTYLGGWGYDIAYGLALDASGAATIAGSTYSPDFPTTPGAFDGSLGSFGWPDAFVARLSPSGQSLIYSTYLGGVDDDSARAVALDPSGAATVAGYARSTNFPTTFGAFQRTNAAGYDAFVTRLSPSGQSLIYSTYLGAGGDDLGIALALDASGAATVAGNTDSGFFRTTAGAFDRTYNGALDAFVARLSPSGGSLVFSTYLGGAARDSAYALGVDASGAVTVAGPTASADFPTTPGAYDTTYGGGAVWGDGFVARLSASGSSLVYSTYLGGTRDDWVAGLALDSAGAAWIAGTASSSEFPTTPGAFQRASGGAFVAQVSASGSNVLYSAVVGRASADALALDATGAATLVGTAGRGFPTTPGAFATAYGGGIADAFVTRMQGVPVGVTRYGRSSAGCQGGPTVHALDDAVSGSATFGLGCSRAPAGARGVLLVAAAGLSSGLAVPTLGAELWVDLGSPHVAVAVTADPSGEHTVTIPLLPAFSGARFFAQYAWADPTCPAPLSASDAVDVTVR